MLISSRFCQRKFNATLRRLNPAWGWCRQCDALLSSLSSTTFFGFILCALAPSPVSSPSPATSCCPRSHPPPLCPPTTWHLFRFIPISWQTACVSTRRAQCSDPHESMADKSMLSLFSMPLLPSIFFFFFFLLLCYLPRLELCSIKLSSLSGTNCSSMRFSAQRQTLMLAPDGAYKSFIYEMPHSSRSCGGFYWSWTWIYWYCEPSFRWGMLDACFDCQVFHFEPELISKTETKQIPFDHIY